jgi:uncharacterized integral membrane protein
MAKEKLSAKASPKSSTPSTPSTPTIFMFQKENYAIMIVGIVVILIGFLLMLGVNNTDPSRFPAEEIYSFRRITLAPIVVMLGFAIEIYAIIKKPKLA